MIWTSAAPLFSLHQTLDRHKIFVVETIAGLGIRTGVEVGALGGKGWGGEGKQGGSKNNPARWAGTCLLSLPGVITAPGRRSPLGLLWLRPLPLQGYTGSYVGHSSTSAGPKFSGIPPNTPDIPSYVTVLQIPGVRSLLRLLFYMKLLLFFFSYPSYTLIPQDPTMCQVRPGNLKNKSMILCQSVVISYSYVYNRKTGRGLRGQLNPTPHRYVEKNGGSVVGG